MSRKTRAAEAAEAASKAAQVLAQHRHEKASEPVDPVSEPEGRKDGSTSPERIEQLLNERPSVQARNEILKKRGLEDEEKPVEAAPEAPKVEPEAPPVVEAKEETPVVPEAPKTVKQTVDGEEHEVSVSEIEEAGGERA